MKRNKIAKLASNLMIEIIKTDLPNKEINRLNDIVGAIRDEAINYTHSCKSDSELLKIPKTTKEQRVQLNEGYNKK
tara:strand:+ start:2089 stop:2316 length:228 start_codon:yes stop_codon:yes gene_type:complete